LPAVPAAAVRRRGDLRPLLPGAAVYGRVPQPRLTRKNPMIPPALPSRRTALKSLASGFGYLAFASLAHEAAARHAAGGAAAAAAGGPRGRRARPFGARAKRLFSLCMSGGPPHVALSAHKPELRPRPGQPRGGAAGPRLFGSPFRFARHGTSGQWVSELLP